MGADLDYDKGLKILNERKGTLTLDELNKLSFKDEYGKPYHILPRKSNQGYEECRNNTSYNNFLKNHLEKPCFRDEVCNVLYLLTKKVNSYGKNDVGNFAAFSMLQKGTNSDTVDVRVEDIVEFKDLITKFDEEKSTKTVNSQLEDISKIEIKSKFGDSKIKYDEVCDFVKSYFFWDKEVKGYIWSDDEESDDEMDENYIDKKDNLNERITKLILAGNKQIIITGAPGTGKTYTARKYAESYGALIENTNGEEKNFEFVKFHSSYDYTDFVEGLRPVIIEETGKEKGKMEFVKVDGIFKSFCRKVVAKNNENNKNSDSQYYFIIDEINRADLSKVFGELMFGLEDSYRGAENHFNTQYKNLPTYEINSDGKAKVMKEDFFKNGFYIPENVVIIGTMNDIDRSVEAFDFALRRRFQWVEVKANDIMEDALISMLNDKLKMTFDFSDDYVNRIIDELSESAKKLNDYISRNGREFGLNDAYHIGPAYFKIPNKMIYINKNVDKFIKSIKDDIWKYRIEPILKEYCRGYDKVQVESFIKGCYGMFFKTSKENSSTN